LTTVPAEYSRGIETNIQAGETVVSKTRSLASCHIAEWIGNDEEARFNPMLGECLSIACPVSERYSLKFSTEGLVSAAWALRLQADARSIRRKYPVIATKGRPFAHGQVARFRGHHMSISDRVFGERTSPSSPCAQP